jgi:formylmethanofuran dehydrogenase subunit E
VRKPLLSFLTAFAVLSSVSGTALSETREQWIELGARVHGAFGAFIPVGIRIGLDAKEKLKADPRGLTVTYLNGEKPPCPCIADGVMIATQASPGQGTFRIAPEKAPVGSLSVVTVRDRKTGEGITYTIADEWLPKILGWNKMDPAGRYDAAMAAEGLFTSQQAPRLP